jgi:hypothetical protein
LNHEALDPLKDFQGLEGCTRIGGWAHGRYETIGIDTFDRIGSNFHSP